ncbi:hypothetical protein [Bacillus sp. PS06]|uniref:hypothetical protein n=1 Tax=Bacillus sp. PS06 TaxID=2764176 RepID=UPI001781B774|nr:hypothetical protein [Bacillus sp. PS06]MBD8070180.1 hypothetical protein [Bacillus sp. PS06]
MDLQHFDIIKKALQSSALALQHEGIEEGQIPLIDQAKDDLLQALSIATSVDKEYLTYLNK